MHIADLLWDGVNIDHIAEHHVEPSEVEELVWNDIPWFKRGSGAQRYYTYGQSGSGRYLFVVLDREYDDVFYVVTARDVDEAEKRRYRQWR